MRVAIRPIALPEHVDEPGPVGDAFRDRVALLDALSEARLLGLARFTARERLVASRSTEHVAQEHVGAYEGERLLGTMTIWLTLAESTDVLDVVAEAHPDLDAAAARTVLEPLLDHATTRAAETGRSTLLAGSVGVAGGAIGAATGFGGADPSDPGVATLAARGFALEQVYRVSARAERGAHGYRVLAWTGPVPDEHRDAVRALHASMSTDAPLGDLALEPETWDDARLAAFERRQDEGGRTMLTVAAQHVASGAVVGFSTLFVLPEGHVAAQHDTIVGGDHRGHGLGMLLKLANLRALAAHPRMTHVTTWNAEENRPMLGVNEAVGFAPVAFEAVWQRRGRGEDAR